ncbi:MAG: ABC transporter ATP-binding protein [Oscillospiraceae bacterium]
MLKRLAGCIREYKTATILTPVFVAGEVVFDALIPLVMAKLIDNGIEKGDLKYTVISGILMLLLAALGMFCGAMSGRYNAIAAAGFGKNLRHDVYHKIQEFSFTNIDKFSTGGLVTRLTTDITNIQQAFMMLTRIASRAPLNIIISLFFTFTISAKLSLIFICAIPVLAAILLFIASKAHVIFERVFNTYDRLNNVVQENLHGIRVVKSFVREEHEKEKFNGVSESIYKDFTKAEKILSFNQPSMQTVIYTCMILISWIGARIIVNSGGTELTTGGLTSLFTYAMQVLMSLMMLSMVYVMITMARADAERIGEVLTEEPTIEDTDNPVMQVKDGSIRFEHVDFSYKGDKNKLCMYDADFEIKSGEVVGIIGGTGSSKSTLVQLIPRLYDATSGTVYVGGVDVKDYDVKTLRDCVAMVLQKNELFSGTIKENLRWGNENATDEELVEACRLAQADGFIREMPDGYDTHIEQGGRNVSGGQKQRLCIARALLKKPKILILDDSTSAVDTRTDALIRAGFRDYIPETTKIIIAQRISSVQDADKIIVMDGGRINGIGTHDELMVSNAIYREVYTSQIKGGEEDGSL